MLKVSIQFPPIQKGIKVSKDHPQGSPYNFVSVIEGHAIVATLYTIICFNLREYFLNYQQINDDEREAFEQLMGWMEGKSFSPDFWEFLTSKNDVSVVDEERINITGKRFDKDLIYHEEEVNLEQTLKLLKDNFSYEKTSIPALGVSAVNLKIIDTTVGKLIGRSALVFQFITVSHTIRFSVDDMSYIFGIVLSSGEATKKPYTFDHFRNFIAKV